MHRFAVGLSLAILAAPVVAVSPPAPSSQDTAEAVSLDPSVPIDDAVTRDRLERMLADGDDTMIVQVFRRYPGKVLPFIDGYLEGGLAMIEKDGDVDGARTSYRQGVRFAELAKDAFGDPVFVDYASSFGSWSPTEQRRFRAGQKAFGDGRKMTDDPAGALALYERSFELAESLGDSWGMAMATGGKARALLALGRTEEAHKAALRAVDLNGRLQLRGSHVRALMLCADIRRRLELPDSGVGHYRLAWQVLPIDAPKEQRMEVLAAFLKALDRTGRTKEATQLRVDEAVLIESMPEQN